MRIERMKTGALWLRGCVRVGVGHLLADDFTKLAGRFDIARAQRGELATGATLRRPVRRLSS